MLMVGKKVLIGLLRGEGEGCERELQRGREDSCSWNSSQEEEKMEGVRDDIMNREGRVDGEELGGSWRREARKRAPKG